MTAPGGRIGGYDVKSMQRFTPEQMQLFQSMFGQLGPDSFLGKIAGGDKGTFDEMEAPALQQFAGLQGNLASRFSGANARRSSGFKNTMNQAASDFAQQLQGRRTDLRRQALQDLWGMSNQLLNQQPYENFLMPQKKQFLEQLLGGALPMGGAALGAGLGYFAGDPWGGAQLGGQIGSAIGGGL